MYVTFMDLELINIIFPLLYDGLGMNTGTKTEHCLL
jgi:hypothetical protein